MKTKMQSEVLLCRFPGCEEAPFSRSQSRGRHESIAHSMKNGVVPNWVKALAARREKAAAKKFSTELPETVGDLTKVFEKEPELVESPMIGARQRLEDAIDELDVRQHKLLEEIDRLQKLQMEATELGRQKLVLSEALVALTASSATAAH